MLADEAVKVKIALDSGAVAHVAGPHSIPGTVRVERPANGKAPRDFVGAKGDKIANFGLAKVVLEQQDGKNVRTEFQVAEVCRPLHSVSAIADKGNDILFMQGRAIVVPAGSFDKLIASITVKATYERSGGLYVAEMTARDPEATNTRHHPSVQDAHGDPPHAVPAPIPSPPAPVPGPRFRRQGAGR